MPPKFLLPGLDTSLSSEGVMMTVLRVADGEPAVNSNGEPMTLTLLGMDSKHYRDSAQKQSDRRTSRGRNPVMSVEEMLSDSVSLLAAMTVAWSGFYDHEGLPIPCNFENARALYLQAPAIRDQADTFIARRVNFLRDASNS
jgi:hypothetical protein